MEGMFGAGSSPSFTGGASEANQTASFMTSWSGGGDINMGSNIDNTRLAIIVVAGLAALWLFSKK